MFLCSCRCSQLHSCKSVPVPGVVDVWISFVVMLSTLFSWDAVSHCTLNYQFGWSTWLQSPRNLPASDLPVLHPALKKNKTWVLKIKLRFSWVIVPAPVSSVSLFSSIFFKKCTNCYCQQSNVNLCVYMLVFWIQISIMGACIAWIRN